MNKLENILKNLQCELVAERNRNNPKSVNWLQYDILTILDSESDGLPSEISILLGISRTKLSKALKELKLMNYVQQKPSEKDGRELITFLTKEGDKVLNDINSGHSHLFQVANKVFENKEQEQFEELAEKYVNALKLERMRYDE